MLKQFLVTPLGRLECLFFPLTPQATQSVPFILLSSTTSHLKSFIIRISSISLFILSSVYELIELVDVLHGPI